MEQLEAVVESTIFRNRENGYSVLSVREGRSVWTVVGMLPELTSGEQVLFSGEWTEHPQYGKQFKCSACEIRRPTTLLGIERYLGSGLIRGVGPSTARNIVAHFGEETLTILSEHPERLQELKGMGRKRWMQIAESFIEQQRAREALVFLQSYGVPPNLSVRISQLYGDRTADVVRENPYRLCSDLEGVGFVTADRIAASLGIPRDSEFRIQSAIRYVLQDTAAGMGHCWLPMEELLNRTASLLQVDSSLVSHEISRLALDRSIVLDEPESGDTRVYLPQFYQAEKEVAHRLCELMASKAPIDRSSEERDIERFEQEKGIRFGEQQRQAITQALESRVLVITGGPGTGKTTIINCIIALLSRSQSVLLCAPTGRAAKRMTEATGMEASTIHRLLEYGGEEGAFSRNEENPLETDCVIVDEASMVDLMLMRSLLRAIEPGMRLILVGDADQLPSVGAGNVLGDILDSGVIRQCRLTEIYRQEGSSRIVVNAHRINHGEMPFLNESGTDFFFVREDSFAGTAQAIEQLVARRLPSFLKYRSAGEIVRNIQVLAPAKKGECGVWALNAALQRTLNPDGPSRPAIQYGETVFRLGDKVIQTKNDYQLEWRRHTLRGWENGSGVFNGDIGFVTEVAPEEHSVTVTFDEEKEAVYQSVQLESLELAYCLSVHKSQGSEFPAVVIPVAGGPPMLLTRNLFYTALTRARQLVVLVGREEVIRAMVGNDLILKRYTSLSDRIRSYAEVLHL